MELNHRGRRLPVLKVDGLVQLDSSGRSEAEFASRRVDKYAIANGKAADEIVGAVSALFVVAQHLSCKVKEGEKGGKSGVNLLGLMSSFLFHAFGRLCANKQTIQLTDFKADYAVFVHGKRLEENLKWLGEKKKNVRSR